MTVNPKIGFSSVKTPFLEPVKPNFRFFTDASLTGWGGVLIPHSISGIWPPHLRTSSINYLELMAIFLSVKHFLSILSGNCVQLMSDNTTAISCITNQGSLSSTLLMSLTSSLLELCHLHSITLSPKHLSGSLNVLADQNSRLEPLATEWSLDTITFNWICKMSKGLQVDLFATKDNHQLTNYVSPCPDPGAQDVNALSLDWNRWQSIYLFPPVPLLPKVASRLLSFKGTGVLIAPFYAQSSWLPNLLARSPSPLPLPKGHTLSQKTKRGKVYHQDPSVFQLHAWPL